MLPVSLKILLFTIRINSTQVTDKIMTVSILKAAKLRNYVPYEFKRTEDIWTTRSALLSYEAALKLETCMEEILNGSSTPAISVLKVALGLVTNTTESTSEAPDATQSPSIKNRPSVRTPASQKKAQTARHVKGKTKDNTNGIPRESSRITNAREVKAIFEMVYPEWERQVKMYQGAPCVRPGMERFESGKCLIFFI
jgi:fanconi-associated nuclease 1